MKEHMKLPRRRFLRLAAGIAALPVAAPYRQRGDLSDAAGASDRPRSSRRHLRHRRTPGRAIAVGADRPADRHREPRRRRHQYRHGRGGARDPRRLHAAARRLPGRDQRHALYQSRFQLRARYRAGRQHRARAADHGGQSGVPGQDGCGIHRLRQEQSRQDQYGLGRRRLDRPCGRRAVQPDGGPQDRPRAVSRRGAVGHRPARRPDPGDVQHARLGR